MINKFKMKVAAKFTISIRKRIQISFIILSSLFVLNGIVTIVVLNNNNKLSRNISTIVDPSLQAMYDFRNMLIESKMYSTNWVFLRSSGADKDSLQKIQNIDFPILKRNLSSLAPYWRHQEVADSLRFVIAGFESLTVKEKEIMSLLQKFDDYDNPLNRLEAERKLEDEVIPQASSLILSLKKIIVYKLKFRNQEEALVQQSSDLLRLMIIVLAVIIILLGIVLSVYMTNTITKPINSIRNIVNDLGKGILRKVDRKESTDEIGEMVRSVNQLSQNLSTTASFASEVGKRNFNAQYQPLSEEDSLGKAILSMRDNLRESEKELLRTHFQMQTFFKNIDSVFFSIDVRENKLLQMSPACEKIFGYNETDFSNNPELWHEFLLNKDQDFLNLEDRDILSGNTFTRQYQISHRGESMRWVESRITPSLNSNGKLVRLDGVIVDITTRKEAEQKLNANELRFRSLIENNADMISMLDENGNYLYVSPSMVKSHGFSYDEFISMNTFEVTHPDDLEKGRELLAVILRSPSVSLHLPRIRHALKNGEYIWIEGTITNLLHVDGVKAIVANFHDITQQKTDEDTLKEQNKELTKTNQELDKFVYSVSHDLRAPLSSMLGVVEISEEETKEELMKEHLGLLKGSINRLDGFIKDILDYSRNARVEVKKEQIDFNELLTDITRNLKFMGHSNPNPVNIKIDIGTTREFVSDKSRVSIILNNLISNAVRYRNPDIKDSIVDVKINMSDTETGIIVRDNGIGISNENKNKIFDMFYRVSENSVGSGLGLYLVKETVEKLNGSIEVESELGKGTSFSVHLPVE